MAEQEKSLFDQQYGLLVKDVFRDHVQRAQNNNEDVLQQVHDYAEHGKPEFVLAYLIAIPGFNDTEKREILAYAFEKRAQIAENRAQAMDTEFNRPFPLINLEARKDYTMARQIREGKMINPYARAPKPLGMQ
jgi:hypothetical protein